MLLCGTAFSDAGMSVEDSGGDPMKRVITVTSTGVYRVEVWHESGGGLNRFYNLLVDPQAKTNVAEPKRGLFEIGWHGRKYSGPDRKDCCVMHILNKKRFVKDKNTGDMVRDRCYDGCADWPSIHHGLAAKKRNDPRIAGKLEIIERSAARVRVRAANVPFMWWHKYVHDLKATGTYTFYPAGRIVVQVHVENPGERTFHWSDEYGPHLMVPAGDREPDRDLGFAWSTPEFPTLGRRGRSGALVLASSDKVKTSFILTIPVEAHTTFDRYRRHGPSLRWDRAGYGSGNLDMKPGYDATWACMIQLAAPAGRAVPNIPDAKTALAYALDYREPARIAGATVVKDDPGDFNKDGFNESEGCHVLKGPGPLRFTYEKGKGAGFAPAFKVIGWQGDAPKTLKIGDRNVSFAAGVADGKLIVQILGTVTGDRPGIGIGE